MFTSALGVSDQYKWASRVVTSTTFPWRRYSSTFSFVQEQRSVPVSSFAAITRKALLSEVTVQEAHEALEVWAAIIRGTLDLMPEDEDLPGALKLALELKHALQDCIYLALAERLDATLITADGKFVAKARGRYPRVQLLGAES